MSEIALIDENKLKPAEIFNAEKPEAMESILNEVKEKVGSIVPDLSTDKGRKEIASLAHKVSKSKVMIDDLGKEYASDLKGKIKVIDGARKHAREFLEDLRDQVRKPLTEWEEEQKRIEEEKRRREEERMEYIESIISAIADMGRDLDGMYHDEAQKLLEEAEAIKIDDSFEEFQERAQIALDATVGNLKKYIDWRLEQEAEAKRLEEQRLEQEKQAEALRKQQEELEAKEREIREKEEAAKREEERIQFEKEAKERAEQEAREKLEREAAEKEQREKEEAERKAQIEAEQREEEARQQALKPDIEKLNSFLAEDVTALYAKASNLLLYQEGADEIKQKILKAIDQLETNIKKAIKDL